MLWKTEVLRSSGWSSPRRWKHYSTLKHWEIYMYPASRCTIPEDVIFSSTAWQHQTFKTAAFWDVTFCSLVDVYKRFGWMWCIHLQCRAQPEGSNKLTHHCNKFKSQLLVLYLISLILLEPVPMHIMHRNGSLNYSYEHTVPGCLNSTQARTVIPETHLAFWMQWIKWWVLGGCVLSSSISTPTQCDGQMTVMSKLKGVQ